ncbi:malonic semialdehyde reductase [Chromatiaceae bacterium AAb-1]|nr:malonic semialdehyde reductase [Chromatiaceae bacterium AAb-1]
MTEAVFTAPLADASLAQLFAAAHTANNFSNTPVPDTLLVQLYELIKWAPTAFNGQPARYFHIRSAPAKEQLLETLSSNNKQKTAAAPVTLVVAYDSEFDEYLPELFPAYDVQGYFRQHPQLKEVSARNNALLQAGYLILAARALGLAAGPMSGFDEQKLNDALFADGRYRAVLVLNLGFATTDSYRPRALRLERDVAWKTL